MKNQIDRRRAFNALTYFLTAFVACLTTTISAQAIFTYGDNSISKEEFLRAYRKNNTTGKPTEKSYRNYLELYARYKLKVKAAYDLNLDKLPNQVTELQNFRNQILSSYLNDESSMNKLISEAFIRAQKDIHLAHIFIAIPKTISTADTLIIYKKAKDIIALLRKGADFSETAVAFSGDPFAKSNKGDLGYITAFSLPYDLENLAYETPVGGFSKIYRGKTGYHIFKNLGQRNDLGKMKAAQILLAFPPRADERVKREVEIRADSIYNALLKGSDFKDLAKKFSGDNLTYQTGGEMPEFGVGKYDRGFEAAAFALHHDGEISHPVLSSFGYHIIKRLSFKPCSTDKDKETLKSLKEKIMTDPRNEVSKNVMLQKILRLSHFQKRPLIENNVWAYTDSALQMKPLPRFPSLADTTILFQIQHKEVTLKDWLDFRKSIRNNRGLTNGKSDIELMDLFIQNIAFDFYRNHAEDYDKEFAYQLNEFKEGNLLFEIMQRQVWDKAASDSLALQEYFEAHKDKYWWQPGADAIVFTCSNPKVAADLKDNLMANPAGWKKWVDSSKGTIQSDSGRFEWAQLPMMNRNQVQAGLCTEFVINPADNTVSFAYLQKLYTERSPRSFKDARGFIINDFQASVENQWIEGLKKKYPVRVNETVLKSLPR
jgi:peptidyl-prolyl cis-trans isomerase SurA